MPRYRLLSIAEKGGLQVHLKKQGIDYKWVLRMFDKGMNNTAIAEAIESRYPELLKPPKRGAVRNWRNIRKEEDGKEN